MDAIDSIAARAECTARTGDFDLNRVGLGVTHGSLGPPLFTRRDALSGVVALGIPAAVWPQDGRGSSAGPGPLARATSRTPAVRALAGVPQRIDTDWTDVQSVLVMQRGEVVLEHYRSGVSVDTLQDTQSVTKSILALLVGAALADGSLRQVDGLVAERLPELLRQGGDVMRLRQLRIEHLLTMTAGWPADQTARRDRDDDLAAIARRGFIAEPGQRFAYDNGSANLLALALSRAVDKPLDDYARERLFAPLGITRFEWAKGGQGHALGALGMRLALQDLARLGELVCQGGRARARQLVPLDYMGSATTRRNTGGPPAGSAYGYLWWVGSPPRRPLTARAPVMASGYGGQWLWIDFAREVVVAATSRRTPQSASRNQAANMIRSFILPRL